MIKAIFYPIKEVELECSLMRLKSKRKIKASEKKKSGKLLKAADFSLDTESFYQNTLYEPLALPDLDWTWFLETLRKPAPIEQGMQAIFPFYSAPFAAILFDPPWGVAGYETPESALQSIPISNLLPSSGVVFLWLPRYHIPSAMHYMQTLGFEYAEYITFVRCGKAFPTGPASSGNLLCHSNMCEARVRHTESMIRYPFEKSSVTVRLIESSATLFIFKKNVKPGALNLQKGVDVIYDHGKEVDPNDMSIPCVSRTLLSRQSLCCRHTVTDESVHISCGTKIYSEIYKTIETIIPVGRFLEIWGTSNNNRSRWISIIPQIF